MSPALDKLIQTSAVKGGVRSPRGFTMIELVMVIVIASILGSAFVSLLIPQVNLFFFFPQRMRIQSAAAELLNGILEGDNQARGLRYAHASAGSNAITAANANSLTYNYRGADSADHTAVLTYSSINHTVTRAVDGGPVQNIPYYATSNSGILIDPVETNFFRYYNFAGAELTGVFPVQNIYRTELAVKASSGSGKVKESEGNIIMKSGVEIKRYVTEVPDI